MNLVILIPALLIPALFLAAACAITISCWLDERGRR